jgi:F-type H+-transporting ATPase subunit epsilon
MRNGRAAVTLHVELVIPEGEIWSGTAQMVIAKTLDGDIGVLTGHAPVLGILAEGSLVRIYPESGEGEPGGHAGGGAPVVAAVSGGFFSVANDRVSVLARYAQLGSAVDRRGIQEDLEAALASPDAGQAPAGEEPSDVRYYRALLRAAGEHTQEQ